jgi:hypothetical protein
MRRFSAPFPTADQVSSWGPALIAAGLGVLLSAAWWPTAPLVSAMALLALGATGATLARFGTSPGFPTILAVHVVVYAGLYVLFVGATLHTATRSGGVEWWRAADLAASFWPMIAASRLSFAALRHGQAAR